MRPCSTPARLLVTALSVVALGLTAGACDAGDGASTGDETGETIDTGSDDETGDDDTALDGADTGDETGGGTKPGETGGDETGGDDTGDDETDGDTGGDDTGNDETGDTGDTGGDDTGDETGSTQTGDDTGDETGDDTGDETGDDTDGGGGTDTTGDEPGDDTNAECEPECDGKVCGHDGCGGSCGTCEANESCLNGACIYQDPCSPNPCQDAPPSLCDGDMVVSYEGPGTCEETDAGYDCIYSESTMTCGDEEICSAGACVTVSDEYPITDDNSLLDTLSLEGATNCCFDLNGDGSPDNGIGDLLSSIGPLLGGSIDIDGALQGAIDDGTVTVLMNLHDLDSNTSDADVTLDILYGYEDGGYYVQPLSFVPDTEIPLVSFPGSITAGTLEAGPATLAASIPVSEALLDIEIHQAQISGFLTSFNGSFALTNGKLGGVIPLEQIVTAINVIAESQCSCLGQGDAGVLQLTAEDTVGCTSAFQFGNSSCGFNDSELCGTLADNKFLMCTAIGIIKPDIDTDDTGKPDAFSVGVVFTSDAVEIKGIGEDVLITGCNQCSSGPIDPVQAAGHAVLFALLLGWLVVRRRRRSESPAS